MELAVVVDQQDNLVVLAVEVEAPMAVVDKLLAVVLLDKVILVVLVLQILVVLPQVGVGVDTVPQVLMEHLNKVEMVVMDIYQLFQGLLLGMQAAVQVLV